MKHSDIVFGTVGTIATFILSHFDKALAITAGLLTVGILILRFRREWIHRNDPPAE
jgi:hypothetical protein